MIPTMSSNNLEVSDRIHENTFDDRKSTTRKHVYQLVGTPISDETMKRLLAEAIKEGIKVTNDFMEDEMVVDHEGPDVINDYLEYIDEKLKLYRMPCCYADESPYKYFLGYIVGTHSPWTDYELFELMSLKVVNRDTVWKQFMHLNERQIEFAVDIYNSNPNIPAPENEFKRTHTIGAFALEYIKKVVIKKKMTGEEFMKYKQVSKYQLYIMYFNMIHPKTIEEAEDMYKSLELDDDQETTCIVMSDDCYSCT